MWKRKFEIKVCQRNSLNEMEKRMNEMQRETKDWKIKAQTAQNTWKVGNQTMKSNKISDETLNEN